MPNENRPLRVFLCHSSGDKPAVRKLHRYLRQRGVQPWLDEVDLLPGQDWRAEIPNAIYSSDVIVVCLSKSSVDKEGYVQKEISFALDKALEKPAGTIFIIPAKLEECNVPARLSHYQWVDLFREGGYKRLMDSLSLRAARPGFSIKQASAPDERQIQEPEKTDAPSLSSPDLPSSLRFNLSKLASLPAMSLLRIVGMILIVLLVFWIGARAMPQIMSPGPTATAMASTTALSSAQASQPAAAMPSRAPFVSSIPPTSLLTASLLPGSTLQHEVVEGESLMLIARCYGANFGAVRNANPEIGDPENLLPGTIITIPGLGSIGRIYGPPCVKTYTIQSGDTWESIAQRYNLDLAVLHRMNPDGLTVGDVVILPLNSVGGAGVLLPPTPLATPAEATSAIRQQGDLVPSALTSYSFQANKGQLMRLKVESDSTSLVIVVYLVEGERLDLTGSGLAWSKQLSQSGKYIIELSNPTEDLKISYTLEVSFPTDATPTS